MEGRSTAKQLHGGEDCPILATETTSFWGAECEAKSDANWPVVLDDLPIWPVEKGKMAKTLTDTLSAIIPREINETKPVLVCLALPCVAECEAEQAGGPL